MSNLGQLRTNVYQSLGDTGQTLYTPSDINASIQDAYNEVAAKTTNIVKTATGLNWSTATKGVYFDFVTDFGITDFMSVISIFDYNSNQYLNDVLSYRDLNRVRPDWELWRGNPQYWVPHSLKYTIICPVLSSPTGTFDLTYYASAPTLSNDSSIPLIATDMQAMLEEYATADLLESMEEFRKAVIWWNEYYEDLSLYKQRCHNLAKLNFLPRV